MVEIFDASRDDEEESDIFPPPPPPNEGLHFVLCVVVDLVDDVERAVVVVEVLVAVLGLLLLAVTVFG